MWYKVLVGIPKNLVYIFACIIIFAFLAMTYITMTEKDMASFMSYDRTKEVVVEHSLFTQL
jgi:hypothetical protein